MKISNQSWEVNSKYMILRLNEPYWSAWQRFGWTEGTEGYSVSREALEKAKELKKKILVKNKYGDYEISASKAYRYYNCQFLLRDGTTLICLPKTAFKRLPDTHEEKPTSINNILSGLSEEQRDELRAKLGIDKKIKRV